MKQHARVFVVAVALGLPATVYADTDDEIRTFATSKYTYCDAKLLAALWKQSVFDSKARIGRKLMTKPGVGLLDRSLGDARKLAVKNRQRCSYDEAGFSYDDAEKLAKVWKRSVIDAKAKIEDQVMAGGTERLRKLIEAAPGDDDDDVGVFLNQERYTYCDAKVISALWKQSVAEGKSYIGLKLRTKNTTAIDRTLVQARANAKKNPAARCRFTDAFSYADAQQLAKLWSISVTEVKARVEEKLLGGGERFVRQQLKGGGDDSDVSVFLKQDKYTYCDAKIIAGLWKKSVENAKAYIGAKLASKNPAAIDNVLVGARANAKKNPAARCTFHDAGFSYTDAEKLARVWKVSESDAKARVEDKLLVGGGEVAIRRLLKR